MTNEYGDQWLKRPTRVTVSERIWELRREHGSLERVEEATGIAKATLSVLRSGKHKAPHPRILKALGLQHPSYYERIDDKGN